MARGSNNGNNTNETSRRRTQRLLLAATRNRRRSSVSPPRRSTRSSTTTTTTLTHPLAGFVTPSRRHQQPRSNNSTLLRDLLLSELPAAPNLAAADPSEQDPPGNNNNTNNSNSGGHSWIVGGGGRATMSRTSRRTPTTTLDDPPTTSYQSNTTEAAAARTNALRSAPGTPTSPRRRLLKNLSIGSLNLNNNNNNNNTEASHKTKGHTSTTQNNNKVKRHHILTMTRRLQQHNTKRYPPLADVLAVLDFWRTTCPSEVTLKILAFLGPSLMRHLVRTQRFLHHLLQQEVAWRVLCEELYKWHPGDPEPESWKEHYRVNPCVPIDFPTIGLALAVVGTGWTAKQYRRYSHKQSANGGSTGNPSSAATCPEIQTNVTIWLRPETTHNVSQAIVVSTLRRSTQVTIRTMHTGPPQTGGGEEQEEAAMEAYLQDQQVKQQQQQQQQPPEKSQPAECHPDSATTTQASTITEDPGHKKDSKTTPHVPIPKRALIQSKTRRRNEPLIRVLRGQLILKQVDLEHSCSGVDIWNGNAAIQVHPSYVHASGSILALIPSATAIIQQSSVKSTSGRGIVTVDGGQLICDSVYVSHCAATGVYVGGRGSCASLTKCDIWYNGTGNSHGGIARGHSGVYVEQSKRIELSECSVAYNTASGISIIGVPQLQQHHHNIHNLDPILPNGLDNNSFVLNKTHVLSNGCSPIDLPHTAFGGGEWPLIGQPEQQQQQNHVPPLHHHQQQQQQHAFPWQRPDHENRIAVVGVPLARSIPLLEELHSKQDQEQEKRQKQGRHRTSSSLPSSSVRRNLSWTGAPWNF